VNRKNKLVSIIIPTFNHAKYVIEAINSVLNQTYQNFELIIIDDGSTDNTKEVVNKIIAENADKKISYFYQKNCGVSAARNKGIHEAKWENITFLDADDIFLDTFLEDMIFKINEGYDWVICDNNLKRIDTQHGTYKNEFQKRNIDFSDDIIKQMLISDRIGTPDRMLIKKGLIIENKICFNEKFACFEDWDFHIQLLCLSEKVGYVEKALVVYRLRDDDSNATRIMKWDWLDYKYNFLKKWKHEFKKRNILDSYSESMWDLARKHLRYTKSKVKVVRCISESLMTSFLPLKKTMGNIFRNKNLREM